MVVSSEADFLTLQYGQLTEMFHQWCHNVSSAYQSGTMSRKYRSLVNETLLVV